MSILTGNYGGDAVLQNNLVTDDAGNFVNASGGDFHLRPNSPAIQAGNPLADVPLDFDGMARPRTGRPDAGAYQFREGGPGLRPPFNLRLIGGR